MAYDFKKYRYLQAQLLALNNSEDSDEVEAEDFAVDVLINNANQNNEIAATNLANSSNECINESDSSGNSSDLEDYGYVESYLSSDDDFSIAMDNVTLNHTEEQKESVENINEQLAGWAVNNNCSRSCVNSLLSILKANGLDLPKDARTLMKTPRNVNTQEKCGGSYIYYGIAKSVIDQIKKKKVFPELHSIELFVNIDGLPLFKSSKTQLWPILGTFGKSEVFLIALFASNSKPTSSEEFLEDFIQESNSLTDTGIEIDNVMYTFSVKAFICDAPARAFLKSIISHTGYDACERCEVQGKYESHRIIYIDDQEFPLRTTEKFNLFNYPGHQKHLSPLTQTPISCINNFILDYMHLCCLGVMKRMIVFLVRGPRLCKLSNIQIQEISNNLLLLNGSMPTEFNRQPRSLSDLAYWKATEYRQFILYTGPLVLKNIVKKNVYNHFLTFSVAMSILLNDNNDFRNRYIDFAQQLLMYFVYESKNLYSNKFPVYNVHNLLHIVDDVKFMECSLNEISAFPYENFMQVLKKKVRNCKNPVIQITKRFIEKEVADNFSNSNNSSVKVLLTISERFRDSCFLLKNGKMCLVKKKISQNEYRCNLFNTNQLQSFYKTPLDSKLLNIFVITDIKRLNTTERIVKRDEFLKKFAILPYKNKHICYQLLHDKI